MNAETILAALDLPRASRVDQRIPKKLLLENGAPTAADRRYINEGIEELNWLAALKPTTIGAPEYRDTIREYLEIAVLQLILRVRANARRLVELVHRAVPYPVLLLTEHRDETELSAVHKRWAQNEVEKTVLDGEIVSVECDDAKIVRHEDAFLQALEVARQPRASLWSFYQGWIDTLLALQAARVTGEFRLAANIEQAAARQEALGECTRLDLEIVRLRAAARKEKQIARQVELNIELKRIEAAKAVVRAKL